MKRKLLVVCGGFALSLAAEAVILRGEEHAEFWWSDVYSFFSLFGFVACLATIVIAKTLGEMGLERKENYYDLKGQHE